MRSSSAGIVSAVASVITALGGLTLAVGYIIPAIKTLRTTKEQVTEVHKLVNQQATDQRVFTSDLTAALSDAGLPVPRDRSLPDHVG